MSTTTFRRNVQALKQNIKRTEEMRDETQHIIRKSEELVCQSKKIAQQRKAAQQAPGDRRVGLAINGHCISQQKRSDDYRFWSSPAGELKQQRCWPEVWSRIPLNSVPVQVSLRHTRGQEIRCSPVNR